MTAALRQPFAASRNIACGLLALLVFPAAAPAVPRDDLLRLVPPDVTFCLTIQNLRDFTKPAQDALGDAFDAAIAGKDLKLPPELQALLKQQQNLLTELNLGITPKQAINELLGDAVVLAYRKGAGDRPEAGMLLVWARDPKLLAGVIDRLNAYEMKHGSLVEVRDLDADGAKYKRRVKKGNGPEDEFYAVRGNVFCFTTSDGLMQKALKLAEAPANEAPPLSKQLEKLAVDKALLSLWLNPRGFEAEFAEREKQAQGPEKAFLSRFLQYWKATEGLAFFMSADAGRAETGVSLRINKAQLPVAAQRFLSEASRPSTLWQVIPDDALFALAGRTDGGSLSEMLSGFMNPEGRQALRFAIEMGLASLSVPRSELNALAAGIGPDWGLWAFAPRSAATSKSIIPQLLFAIRLQSGDDGLRAQSALLDALQGVAVIVCNASGGRIAQEKERDGQVEIRCLVSDQFPPGLRPAYAAKAGYFLIAGSPETIRGFRPPTADPKASEETPFLRVSLKGWKNYLSQNSAAVAEYMAAMQQTTPEIAGKLLGDIVEGLEGADRLEVFVRSGADQAAIVVRVRAAEPKR